MFITQKKLTGSKELTLTLMSDLHFGAPNVDYARMLEDLEEAKRNNDRILLDGDIFDMILPGDVKRYIPEALATPLQGRSNIVNVIVKYAAEFLKPYATQIDMIATGNHEESVMKYHHVDPVQLLVGKLNENPGADVYHGARLLHLWVQGLSDKGASRRGAKRHALAVFDLLPSRRRRSGSCDEGHDRVQPHGDVARLRPHLDRAQA